MRSLLRLAARARIAASSAETVRLSRAPEPRSWDALMSTSRITVPSRSSAKSLICGRFMRAETFQSMAATSSPGW